MPVTLAEVKAKNLQLISDELDAGVYKGLDLVTVLDALSRQERVQNLKERDDQLVALRTRLADLKTVALQQRAEVLAQREQRLAKARDEKRLKSEYTPAPFDPKKGTRHMQRLKLNELNNTELREIMDSRRHWLLTNESMGYEPSGLTQKTKDKETNIVSAFFTWLDGEPNGRALIDAQTDEPWITLDESEAKALDMIRRIDERPDTPAQPFSPDFPPINAQDTHPPEAQIPKPMLTQRANTNPNQNPNCPVPFKAQGLGPEIDDPNDENEPRLTPYQTLAQKQLAYYDYPDPDSEDPPE